jgi:hypothetical protein
LLFPLDDSCDDLAFDLVWQSEDMCLAGMSVAAKLCGMVQLTFWTPLQASSTRSTFKGEMFSPPLMIKSLYLPKMNTLPSESICAWSPVMIQCLDPSTLR